jgi:preprotein translocase subunit SecE
MPREGAARQRRSEMIRAVLIVVVIVAGLMLLFLIPFLDLP